MDNCPTTCDDCPFSAGCPLKSHVDAPCVIGRNPVKFYVSGWTALIAASLFLF